MDDSANFRNHLAFMLNETGHVMVAGTAESLASAIRLVDQESPELVFLDVLFEQGTGIEVLEHLRSTSRSTHVAVMTIAPSPQLEKFCYAMGADWFVDKANSFETIVGICEEIAQTKLHAAGCNTN